MRTGGQVIMAMAIGIAAGIPALAALRCFAAEHANACAAEALAARQPVGIVDAWVRRALWIAAEFGTPRALRGQAFVLWAEQAGGQAAKQIAGLAAGDLAAAARLVPAQAPVFTAAARAAGVAGQRRLMGPYAREAVERRPGYAEYAWAWARALPPQSADRRRAYRSVTALAPEATPRVLAEAAPGAQLEERRRFVAPSAPAYRAWAWSITDAAPALRVARWGLALPRRPGDARDRARLAYLVALRTAEHDAAGALAWYRTALETLGDEQAVYRNYGFALLRAGEAAPALRAFEASLRLQPGLTNPAHLGIGQAHEALGQTSAALAVYRRLQRQPHLEAWIRRQAGDGIYRLEHQN